VSSLPPTSQPANPLSRLLARPSPSQVLLVTYDLRTAGRDYNPFFESLKQQGNWWHYISSTWLISTLLSPQQLYSNVVRHITTSDSLLIIPIKRPYWGYLSNEAWEWIDANLPK
jgi:hypothetical protein